MLTGLSLHNPETKKQIESNIKDFASKKTLRRNSFVTFPYIARHGDTLNFFLNCCQKKYRSVLFQNNAKIHRNNVNGTTHNRLLPVLEILQYRPWRR